MGFSGNFWIDVHMVWRWVLLAAGLVSHRQGAARLARQEAMGQAGRPLGMIFTIAVDIQFLLGLILWFVGPFKITNAGALMSERLARFYVIEHPLLMLVALALAHIGRSRSRKAATGCAEAQDRLHLLSLELRVHRADFYHADQHRLESRPMAFENYQLYRVALWIVRRLPRGFLYFLPGVDRRAELRLQPHRPARRLR